VISFNRRWWFLVPWRRNLSFHMPCQVWINLSLAVISQNWTTQKAQHKNQPCSPYQSRETHTDSLLYTYQCIMFGNSTRQKQPQSHLQYHGLRLDQSTSHTKRTFCLSKNIESIRVHLRHITTGTLNTSPSSILKTKILLLFNLFEPPDINF
jgi:hypothetical protein